MNYFILSISFLFVQNAFAGFLFNDCEIQDGMAQSVVVHQGTTSYSFSGEALINIYSKEKKLIASIGNTFKFKLIGNAEKILPVTTAPEGATSCKLFLMPDLGFTSTLPPQIAFDSVQCQMSESAATAWFLAPAVSPAQTTVKANISFLFFNKNGKSISKVTALTPERILPEKWVRHGFARTPQGAIDCKIEFNWALN